MGKIVSQSRGKGLNRNRFVGARVIAMRFRRSAARVEPVFQAQVLGGRQGPDFVSQRSVTTNRFPDPSDLGLKHRRIDRFYSTVTPWRRPGIQLDQGCVPRHCTVKAGPASILGPFHKSRTQRIPLDVPQHHSEVIILLNR